MVQFAQQVRVGSRLRLKIGCERSTGRRQCPTWDIGQRQQYFHQHCSLLTAELTVKLYFAFVELDIHLLGHLGAASAAVVND